VQTTRLAESFTRSVVLTRPEKFPRKAMCDPALLHEPFELTWLRKC